MTEKEKKNTFAGKTPANLSVTCGFSSGVWNRGKLVQSNKYRRKILRKSCGLFSLGKSAGKARISSSVGTSRPNSIVIFYWQCEQKKGKREPTGKKWRVNFRNQEFWVVKIFKINGKKSIRGINKQKKVKQMKVYIQIGRNCPSTVENILEVLNCDQTIWSYTIRSNNSDCSPKSNHPIDTSKTSPWEHTSQRMRNKLI